jgi:glycine/D-amino acid oxidase-like deaminating enzyme
MDNAVTLSESQGDYGLRLSPRIQLALNEREELGLTSTMQPYHDNTGFSARHMERSELQRLEPDIAPEVLAGALLQGNYSVNTQQYAGVLLRSACAEGARLITDEVLGIRHKGLSVESVILSSGIQVTGAVIFATGPWMSGPAKWLSTLIPITAVKGQLLRLPRSPVSTGFDLTNGLTGLYHQTDGSVLLRGTEEAGGLPCRADKAGKSLILSGLARILRPSHQLEVTGHGAAARPVSADHLPVIGRVPDWDNAYLLTGGGRKGVLYSSGMGYAISHELVTGKPWPAALRCNPARFSNTNATGSLPLTAQRITEGKDA